MINLRFLRSLAFNAIMFGTGTVLSLWGILLWRLGYARLDRMPILWAKICLAALRLFCGVRLRIEGREYLPPPGGAIVAAQHQSTLDVLIWLTLLPHPSFVFKRELAKIPLFGVLLEPTGMVPVDRGGAGQALRKMVSDCATALDAGRQIILFPEGTRVLPGKRARLHPGIVALAKANNLPLIPAATDSGLSWGAKAFRILPGIVTVKLYPPIAPETPQDEILARLATYFYDSGVT
ncbi:1-acyl-sn-glycerol-3-phosphate acyltransferase [Acidocella sp.]|uniref:lysophospholipid acyltransferase family protein n=1 Tax=Acidocella sp. TaxID=50710 RepID=UPI00262DD570|nr:lysophospholipid acyltransferase family protein [Acidocella sp.]MDD2794270.1 lysophospholipid acyltransferase family protein [Acidocella sp.]